jgi:hypothetical protein
MPECVVCGRLTMENPEAPYMAITVTGALVPCTPAEYTHVCCEACLPEVLTLFQARAQRMADEDDDT